MDENIPDNHNRSTIGLKLSTKQRMDRCRAPGQCYDGFITQMMDHWGQTTDKVSHKTYQTGGVAY